MKSTASSDSRSIKVIRWIARIMSLLVILATLFLMIPDVWGAPLQMAVVMGLLIPIGLGIAWKWELVGALISLVGFIGAMILNPDMRTNPMMYLFYAVPAILFLLCWWRSKSLRPQNKI